MSSGEKSVPGVFKKEAFTSASSGEGGFTSTYGGGGRFVRLRCWTLRAKLTTALALVGAMPTLLTVYIGHLPWWMAAAPLLAVGLLTALLIRLLMAPIMTLKATIERVQAGDFHARSGIDQRDQASHRPDDECPRDRRLIGLRRRGEPAHAGRHEGLGPCPRCRAQRAQRRRARTRRNGGDSRHDTPRDAQGQSPGRERAVNESG